jgi:hypothetical protein
MAYVTMRPRHKDESIPNAADSAAEAAGYIGSLARELHSIAAKYDLGFLAYLLAMAEEEAEATARRLNGHGSDAA